MKQGIEITKLILAILGFIISLIAIGFSYWNYRSQSYIEKASRGDSSAQIFLADYYFNIGKYDESFYWYTILSTTDCDYQAIACNNLGYMYAKGLGLSDEYPININRNEKAFELFFIASKLGQQTSIINTVIFLRNNHEENFRNYDYGEILSMAEEKMNSTDGLRTGQQTYRQGRFIEQITSSNTFANSSEYVFRFVSSEYKLSDDGSSMKWIFTYNKHKAIPVDRSGGLMNIDTDDIMYIPYGW
ncbi:MAG: hypothetical protein LBD23_04225 [Oscillospiraceae bacterium]|jgi:TPR repeat protein|nr:hypothetical protein [Oscillospiraceae bacterium]